MSPRVARHVLSQLLGRCFACAVGAVILGAVSVYLQGHDDSVLRSHRRRTAENSAAYLLPHLRVGMSVLHVGRGPGTITRDLATAVGRAARVVGVDPSPVVLPEAASADAGSGVKYVRGDVLALPFRDEMRRVVAPGGLVAVRDADFGAMTWWPDVPGPRPWRDAYRTVARLSGGEPDAGRRLFECARQPGGILATAAA